MFASKKSSKCCHEALACSGASTIVSPERSLAVWRLQSIILAICNALSRQFCTLCLAVAYVLDLTMHPFVNVFEAGALVEHRLVGLYLAEDWL
jgi:hypothetical protein